MHSDHGSDMSAIIISAVMATELRLYKPEKAVIILMQIEIMQRGNHILALFREVRVTHPFIKVQIHFP